MIKIALFPKLMYRFNTIPVKIMTVFFAQSYCNIHTEIQGTQNSHKNLGEKKNKAEGFTRTSFENYYKATVIRTI